MTKPGSFLCLLASVDLISEPETWSLNMFHDVSCKVRNCNFVDSWHAGNFACWWCWHEAEMFSISLPSVEEVSRLLMRGSWYQIGFRCQYSQHFPLSQTSNEFKQKQQNPYITEPPLFPRLEGQQKTKNDHLWQKPGSNGANSSISRVARKYRQKKHENQHRNFAQKVQNITTPIPSF